MSYHLTPVRMTFQKDKKTNASKDMVVKKKKKNPHISAGDIRDVGSIAGNIRWRRKWQLPPVFLPGESYGQRSLAGYSL